MPTNQYTTFSYSDYVIGVATCSIDPDSPEAGMLTAAPKYTIWYSEQSFDALEELWTSEGISFEQIQSSIDNTYHRIYKIGPSHQISFSPDQGLLVDTEDRYVLVSRKSVSDLLSIKPAVTSYGIAALKAAVSDLIHVPVSTPEVDHTITPTAAFLLDDSITLLDPIPDNNSIDCKYSTLGNH